MTANTAQEQLMLELINRARMDPAAEAARLGISLNQGLPSGTISSTPKQVLAMNDDLVEAADNHSDWMLTNDQFSHTELSTFPSGRTGLNPDDRMEAAGYVFATSVSAWGENISWTGTPSGTINLSTAIVDQHKSLFLSPGHRENILDSTFREVGVGQEHGTFTSDGHSYDASMITQNFARSGGTVFVTGVVYNDTTVNDNFFSIGEQTTNRAVTSSGASDTTGGGGGYALGFSTQGPKTITFDLTTGDVAVNVNAASVNIKLDIVNGKEVWTNSDLSVKSGPVYELHALGILDMRLTGGSHSERIYGNRGDNSLSGGDGNDTIYGKEGVDRLTGGADHDYFVFDVSLTSANRDSITDFSHTYDTIRLENSIFKGTGSGTLNSAYYYAGTKAHDSSDRIIYNKATGALYYDSDGTGSHSQIQFATLTTKPTISYNDFVLI
jgi:Ca2+-binding RTX toxin-like protein